MDLIWKQVLPQDRFFVKLSRAISREETGFLFQLYQPIVGTPSVALYQTLLLEVPEHKNLSLPATHRWLMSLTGLALDEIVHARERLEAVGLMRSRKHDPEEGDACFEYTLFPPLVPAEFFAQDILRTMLFNEVGKTGYAQLRARFSAGRSAAELSQLPFVDVTKSFDEVYTHVSPQELMMKRGSETERAMTEANEQYPLALTSEKMNIEIRTTDEIDWDFIRARLPKTVEHKAVLTEEVIRTVKELAFLFRLDSYLLAHFLNEPYVYKDDQTIDVPRLREVVRNWYDREEQSAPVLKEKRPRERESAASGNKKGEAASSGSQAEVHRSMLERLSPVSLLEHYQGGGKVSKSDLLLVEELMQSYGLRSGVVNVLLEYVMLTNEKQLPRALITKIAAHWKRLNIETVEEAQEQARQLFHKRSQKTAQPEKGRSSGKKATRSASGKRDLPEWIVRQLDEEKKEQPPDKTKKTKELEEKEKKILEMLKEFGDVE